MMPIACLRYILFLSVFLIPGFAYAQDTIYLKSSPKPLSVKVLNINRTEVKYHPARDSFPVIYLPLTEVRSIKLASGNVFTSETHPRRYATHRAMCLKTAYLAPGFGHINLGVEQNTGNDRSWEVIAGVIGVGAQDEWERASGVYLRGGYKMTFRSHIYEERSPVQILQGLYLKPELAFGAYTIRYGELWGMVPGTNKYGYFIPPSKKVGFGSMMMNLGYQLVLPAGLVFDWSFGFGYYADNLASDNSEDFYYCFIGTQNKLAFTLGMKIGYAFSRPVKNKKLQ